MINHHHGHNVLCYYNYQGQKKVRLGSSYTPLQKAAEMSDKAVKETSTTLSKLKRFRRVLPLEASMDTNIGKCKNQTEHLLITGHIFIMHPRTVFVEIICSRQQYLTCRLWKGQFDTTSPVITNLQRIWGNTTHTDFNSIENNPAGPGPWLKSIQSICNLRHREPCFSRFSL